MTATPKELKVIAHVIKNGVDFEFTEKDVEEILDEINGIVHQCIYEINHKLDKSYNNDDDFVESISGLNHVVVVFFDTIRNMLFKLTVSRTQDEVDKASMYICEFANKLADITDKILKLRCYTNNVGLHLYSNGNKSIYDSFSENLGFKNQPSNYLKLTTTVH